MSAQINDFARCANYGYPGFNVMDCGCLREKNKKQKKNPTPVCWTDKSICVFIPTCVQSALFMSANRLTHLYVSVCLFVQASHADPDFRVDHEFQFSARCETARVTCLTPERWPAPAASLINLMDSWLTQDEFIRWLHFTLLIFMQIGKAGRGQGQEVPVRRHLND